MHPSENGPAAGDRVVVVSPHLDDGVMALGAAMSSWSRRGVRVELLTVLGCDPESPAPVGGWDRRGGFVTEGESARARRNEDARACVILGASPSWLPFGSVDYDRHGDESSVGDAALERIGDVDAVLLPGFPLSHPDHAWLVRVLLGRCSGARRLAFYAEQPYAARSRVTPVLPAWLGERLGADAPFSALPRSPRAALAKWRAIRCYRSQLRLLALDEVRRGANVLVRRPELVTGWLDWPRL